MQDKINSLIEQSNFISRDLSWLKFNERVLDQARNEAKNIIERLRFLTITASNLDEFCMIRVGSLYNYLDYNKERMDYSGLREIPFRLKLLQTIQSFSQEQNDLFKNILLPRCEENGFKITSMLELEEENRAKANRYFDKTIFPMLTPMVFDTFHVFPVLMNKTLILGVVTKASGDEKEQRKLSFVQIPQNIPRFYEIDQDNTILFIPIEDIIRWNITKLFKNIEIMDTTLFRITRNGDFSLDELDDVDTDFIDEIKRKLKTRRTGRVVRVEIEKKYSKWMMKILMKKWEIDENNLLTSDTLIDFTGLNQLFSHHEFKDKILIHNPIPPISYPPGGNEELFTYLKKKDILLHHPYNSMEPVLYLLEKAAEDPDVLAIKLTIYRLAKESRVTNALLKAAENGKHVSVLFEIKARFDEERNIQEAERLQKAGCFVIYGIGSIKTHTKLLMIVRKDGEKIIRYVHLSSGNYNEDTTRMYTDMGILTTNETYAHDIADFFNVITGHSIPNAYTYLLTAPHDLRSQLINLIRQEAEHAKKGLPSGIVIKINSLEDKRIIEELYQASQAGVRIKLIVRGICCLRPGRNQLSENITVVSIVGDFLEHLRCYYFHNHGDPKIYGGSADIMVRSFDRRIESLFMIADPFLKQQAINILCYNLKDNVNAYHMLEDGRYIKKPLDGQPPFNIHNEFFHVTEEVIKEARLF